MKTLGVLGGMSWESTALYYRWLNEGVRQRLGGLHSAPLLLWSCDFAQIAQWQQQGQWQLAGQALAQAARQLQQAGAEGLLLATNTMHKVAQEIEAAVDIPLLHIADATGQALVAQGIRQPLLLATAYTMEQDFYRQHLRQHWGIEVQVPEATERAEIQRIIFAELCQGVIAPSSQDWARQLVAQQQTDGLILGCTELGLLLPPEQQTLPVLDSARLHVQAALDWMLD
ncbi:aspartate/glutamate racemase family protein [Balneatrix alpica]|uniref:aspartate/glutamate racemase family protein n=1 Tax=Balneatrix alpica TaxID=75684 RepID=UPI00273A13B6|nr:amino acid racemase [Balneatrix alpica]